MICRSQKTDDGITTIIVGLHADEVKKLTDQEQLVIARTENHKLTIFIAGETNEDLDAEFLRLVSVEEP